MNEPLGLPQGSVRAIIALLVVVATVIALFVGKEAVVDKFSQVAILVIGYYFGQRSGKGDSNAL